MTNFWTALEQVDQPEPSRVPEYRLYYDKETGEPLFYSAEQPEGTFIWIGHEDFTRHRFDIRIKDGKIVQLKPGIGKLVPGTDGTETDSTDISLVSSNTNTYWKNKTYELD